MLPSFARPRTPSVPNNFLGILPPPTRFEPTILGGKQDAIKKPAERVICPAASLRPGLAAAPVPANLGLVSMAKLVQKKPRAVAKDRKRKKLDLEPVEHYVGYHIRKAQLVVYEDFMLGQRSSPPITPGQFT